MILSLPVSDYKSPRGQLFAQLLSGSRMGEAYPLGDVDFTQNMGVEKVERNTNEFAIKTLAYSRIDSMNVELTITCYQAGIIASMASALSDQRVVDQPAAPNQTVIVEGIKPGMVIELPHRKVGDVVLSDGNSVPYVEGVHYTYSTGKHAVTPVSIIAIPAGAGTDVQIDYDGLASKGDRYDFGSASEIMVRLVYVENVLGDSGQIPDTRVYHKVGLTVDGDLQLIGDGQDRTITLKGKCYADTTKPAGQMIGYLETNVRAA